MRRYLIGAAVFISALALILAVRAVSPRRFGEDDWGGWR